MEIQTFIINLVTRVDRRVHILSEVTKMPSLKPTLVEGIVDNTGTCFQSQRLCIQKAKDLNLPYVAILEDDALFTSDCIQVFNKAFLELQNITWDMFYLGANLYNPAQRVSDNLLKLSGAWCAHAYLVHNRFYDIILNLPHDREMDTHYGELMKTNNTYMCNPMIAYQLPSHSNLQNGFRDYNEAMNTNFSIFTQ